MSEFSRDSMPLFYTAVALGQVAGYARASGIGYIPDVDVGTVPQDAWGLTGLFPWINSLTSLEAVSTSPLDTAGGTGARTVTFATLIGDYVDQPQTVALNGTTPVPIPIQAIANNGQGSRVVSAGVLENNAGDIILRDAGGGTVRGIILAGKGVMRQAPYTVPAGKRLIVPQLFLNVEPPNGATGKFAVMETYFRNPAGVAVMPLYIGNSNVVPYPHFSDPPIIVAEKTRFSLRVTKVLDNNTIVTAGWNGILKG